MPTCFKCGAPATQQAHVIANTRYNMRAAGRLYDKYWGLIHTKAEREKIGRKILDHPENKKWACSLKCNAAAMIGYKGKVRDDHLIYLISMMEGVHNDS